MKKQISQLSQAIESKNKEISGLEAKKAEGQGEEKLKKEIEELQQKNQELEVKIGELNEEVINKERTRESYIDLNREA